MGQLNLFTGNEVLAAPSRSLPLNNVLEVHLLASRSYFLKIVKI